MGAAVCPDISRRLVRQMKARGVLTVNVFPDCSPHAHGRGLSRAIGEYDLVVSAKPFHPGGWQHVYGLRNTCVCVPHGYDPAKATPLPPADAPRELYIQRAFEMVPNTAPFNASGHPAMSLPCGMSDGLPVGLMLIGKYFDEPTIYRAAAAFEGAGDWKKM